VSITTNPREGESRDAMLAELTRAFEEITRESPSPARPIEEVFKREDETSGRRSDERVPLRWGACHYLAPCRYGALSVCWL
jgi:hypothetical protein